VSHTENSVSNGDRLFADLPAWLNKNHGSNNYALMQALGESFDVLDEYIEKVENAATPHYADTIAQLEKHGAMVGVTPRDGESVESYRTRVISGFQKINSSGTHEDILGSVSTLLNTNPESISFLPSPEDGLVRLSLPSSALDNLNISSADFVAEIQDQLTAGYRIDVQLTGTLEYISVSQFDAGAWDFDAGYDTLVNGEPTGEGGTYSGILAQNN
jgi:hypothetical protein